jgi:hypothetical protein
MVEQLTLNQRVVGSIPTAPTSTQADFQSALMPHAMRISETPPRLRQGKKS